MLTLFDIALHFLLHLRHITLPNVRLSATKGERRLCRLALLSHLSSSVFQVPLPAGMFCSAVIHRTLSICMAVVVTTVRIHPHALRQLLYSTSHHITAVESVLAHLILWVISFMKELFGGLNRTVAPL